MNECFKVILMHIDIHNPFNRPKARCGIWKTLPGPAVDHFDEQTVLNNLHSLSPVSLACLSFFYLMYYSWCYCLKNTCELPNRRKETGNCKALKSKDKKIDFFPVLLTLTVCCWHFCSLPITVALFILEMSWSWWTSTYYKYIETIVQYWIGLARLHC